MIVRCSRPAPPKPAIVAKAGTHGDIPFELLPPCGYAYQHPRQGDRGGRLGPLRVRAEHRWQREHDRTRQRELAVLRDHKARQDKERADWGDAWHDTKVFTKEDGSWLHPETISEAFRRILATTDLPPIILRDLRHVAATLTQGPENEAAPDPAEAESGAA